MTSYNELFNYYKMYFDFMLEYKYNQSDIDSWYPFERDIYVKMINDRIKAQQEAQQARY